MVKLPYLGFANEKYKFKFEIVNDGKAIHLQDKKGFNFLSVQLFKDDSRLIDDNVANRLMDHIRGFSESYLKEVQERWILEQRERELMVYFKACASKRQELKMQLKDCTDDLEKELLRVQIERLEEILHEYKVRAQIDY